MNIVVVFPTPKDYFLHDCVVKDIHHITLTGKWLEQADSIEKILRSRFGEYCRKSDDTLILSVPLYLRDKVSEALNDIFHTLDKKLYGEKEFSSLAEFIKSFTKDEVHV